jgi:peptide-methionine (S)-S-oxide reductase
MENVTQEHVTQEKSTLEKATFGAGCFWGVEAAFRQIKGVVSTAVGFSGGNYENPSYHDVCTGRTGHAEVVEVTYDPARVSYEDLLKVFWENHNPTTLNRQGWDVGTQYRSAIYFHNAKQEAAARVSKEQLEKSGKYRKPIVTEVTPASTFYMAEDYHQQYLEKRGLSSCHI